MILLEINEFSPDLLKQASKICNGENLNRLLKLKLTSTTAIEKEERFGLDPWVQWVSIHTGVPAELHQTNHLGDVPDLKFPQIWETLGKMGFSTGIWGAMNASRREAENNKFFFPDPWTYSEKAYPKELNELLAFPRYYSKNYCDISIFKALFKIITLLKFCVRPSNFSALIPIAPLFFKSIIKNGISDYLLFVLFDLVNCQLFSKYFKKYHPDFSVIFLNSIAHLQHHKWTDGEELSIEMRIAFTKLDKALGTIFSIVDEYNLELICVNAFSQVQSYDRGEFLYRQKNPEIFLRALGVKFSHIEQAMTNDGHVFFKNFESLNEAIRILSSVRIGPDVAFSIDASSSNENRIFFQFVIWRKILSDEIIEYPGGSLIFYEWFDEVTRRSGVHTQNGHVFSSGVELPTSMNNFDLHDQILNHFKSKFNI